MNKQVNIVLSLTASGLIPLLAQASQPQVVINEIIQSNVTTLYCDGEFPDSWVELFNTTDSPVDLGGWKIGVKEKASKAYTLPEGTVIAAGAHLLVYCDKEEEGLHTSFRLESGEGSVYLFDPSGNLVESVSHKKMPAPDIAYGRMTDGAAEWSYFVTSTPGKSNEGATSSELLQQPVFSNKGGLFDGPLTVTVSIPDVYADRDDVRLCITTDGSEPEAADSIKSPCQIEVTESTPVRARLYSPKALSGVAATQTYLIPGREIKLPVFCVNTNDEYLYSEEMGSLYGDSNDPSSNIVNKWRRPMNVEMYDGENHEQVINQLGETGPQGGSSLQWPQKSLKIYANKRFGTKNFGHVLWPDTKPDVKSVKSFSLRNAGNTFALDHLRDSYLHLLFGPTTDGNVDYMTYRPAVAYVNGRPYGLIDIRERSNEDFIEANYPDIDEDFALVEDWNEYVTDSSEEEFIKLWQAYHYDYSFEKLNELVDVNSFAPILLADAFGFNLDTPGGNKIMWKPVGGKWRWLLKDMDVTLNDGLIDNDYISYLMMEPCDEYFVSNISEESTLLYRRFLSHPEFTSRLIDLFVAYNGDFLNPEYSLELLDRLAAEIRDEREVLKELYDLPSSLDYFVENLKPYITNRCAYMADNLRRRYELGATVDLKIRNTDTVIALNGHKLVVKNYSGVCYAGRKLTLEAEADGSWYVMSKTSDGTTTETVLKGRSVEFVPAEGVTACEIDFKADGSSITQVGMAPDSGTPVYFDLNGRRLSGIPSLPGVYVRVTGIGSEKIVVR